MELLGQQCLPGVPSMLVLFQKHLGRSQLYPQVKYLNGDNDNTFPPSDKITESIYLRVRAVCKMSFGPQMTELLAQAAQLPE